MQKVITNTYPTNAPLSRPEVCSLATMGGGGALNFGYTGRRIRKTKRITFDRNLPPTSIPSVGGLAAHLTKLSPTLLDDGIETSSEGFTRRKTRASMLVRRNKKHWRKMRTVTGREGPLEMRHARLRDPHARAIMRFRWAQYMTEGENSLELTAHERTRYMQMQAHAMQAMMSEKPKKAEALKPAVVKSSEDFETVMEFLWRSGAMAKTRAGLLSRYAYERFNYLLHYALLPNLMDADEAFASAKADWERDVARSENEWPVDPEDVGGDDSVDDEPNPHYSTDAVGIRAAQESKIPNFKGSDLGHFPLVSADFWTSDHLSERSRSVDMFSVTRARETLTLKRR